MTLNKRIITNWEGRVLTALMSDSQVVQLELEDTARKSLLNNIYIGKVKNVVKNINSAFVDIGNGQMAYYSLTENTVHHYTKPHAGTQLHPGDEIIVQIAKDAVKTKDPVITSCLSFTGKYSVLTAGKNHIGFSSKITDIQWKQTLKTILEQEKEAAFGIIIRTNASDASEETIVAEIRSLKAMYHQVMEMGAFRTCYSLLYEASPCCISSIRDTYAADMGEIVTDDLDMFRLMKEYLNRWQPEDVEKLRFYEDDMVSLIKLYPIEKALQEALGKRVWLKSGGYLVIEPTEALTVIDVNTGKYSGKKNLRDTIMKINLEAAQETARQLRLRNLSGIIIIDFIDMEAKEDQKLLLQQLTAWCLSDPVKVTVMGITNLNLVELTRKKLRKPLHEIVLGRRQTCGGTQWTPN